MPPLEVRKLNVSLPLNQALVLHSDNGSAMKSSTMKAKMEELGVTPSERHAGKDSEILQKRSAVLEVRREQNPERWSGEIRNCKPVGNVHLNPEKEVA
jgi:transposase InsO family protein